jgi:uncharacterized membrane protein YecN with MAPEG domain
MPKEAIFTALVTSLALVFYLVVTLNVGRARGKYNVPAPQTSGNPDFERVLRVQQNTLEQSILFLPSLWLFTLLVDPKIGAGLGAVWIVGRILYAWGYYRAAEKRGPGFGIGFLAAAVLLIGSIYGAIKGVLSVV